MTRRYLLPAVVALGVSISPGPLLAQSEARLVGDLARHGGDFHAWISAVTPVSAGVVFSKNSVASGLELWVTDGTGKGTKLLKDIVPGSQGSFPEGLVRSGERAFFTTDTLESGRQVWVTDGTPAGTTQVSDHPFGNGIGVNRTLGGIASGAFFEAQVNAVLFTELWFTDGTPAGTRLLNPFDESGTERVGFAEPQAGQVAGDKLYFIANGKELWSSDGSAAGTAKLLDDIMVSTMWQPRFIVAGSKIYLTATATGQTPVIWCCDLDGGNLVSLQPAAAMAAWNVRSMAALGDRLYLVAEDNEDQRTLWTSDGTQAGTRSIPLGSSEPGDHFIEWQGQLYFGTASDTTSALWRTHDVLGAAKVANLGAPHEGEVTSFVAAGNVLYYQVMLGGSWEQWRTDGTEEGTRRVARLLDGTAGPEPQAAEWQGSLYYAASRNSTGNALWRTRGSKKGVMRLTVSEKTTGDAYAAGMDGVPYAAAGGKLLFFVIDPDGRGTGYELWEITPRGRAKSIWKVPAFIGHLYYGSLAFRGTFGADAVFSMRGDFVGEVWATDGTARGTRVLSVHGGTGNAGYPQQFLHSNNRLFYSVMPFKDSGSAEIWVTDGTAAQTKKVVDANGDAPQPLWGEMVDLQGVVYFLARNDADKIELWKTDGSASGTQLVKGTWDETGQGTPSGLAAIGNRISITLQLALTQQLWTSDGTPEGTREVQTSFSPETEVSEIGISFDLGGLQVFTGRGYTINDTWQWWVSDGTDAGTHRLMSGVTWHHLAGPGIVSEGKIYYPGTDEDGDGELWVTDGTAEGTRRLKDIWVGGNPSSASNFIRFGSDIYFTATDVEHGAEVWKTDGTEAGTVIAADVEPGLLGSDPKDLQVIGGKLYFHADRPAIGRELYVIDPE
jgi:ELWxxDGT repeat protein